LVFEAGDFSIAKLVEIRTDLSKQFDRNPLVADNAF
jgi:hypothetical protein